MYYAIHIHPARVYRHADGRKHPIQGVAPFTSHTAAKEWDIVDDGWEATMSNGMVSNLGEFRETRDAMVEVATNLNRSLLEVFPEAKTYVPIKF